MTIEAIVVFSFQYYRNLNFVWDALKKLSNISNCDIYQRHSEL